MAPRRAFEDLGRHSGESLGGARSVEKLPGTVFLRFLRAKYTYFQGFKHANFVDLIGPFGASGRSWENLGLALGAPKALWEAPGGVLSERAWALEGSRERPETEKRDFGALLVFPKMLLSLRLQWF